MKPLNSKANANLMVLNLAFCSLIALFYSCGNGGGGDSAATFGKGSVGFSLALENPAAARAVSFRAAADSEVQFECENAEYQIDKIEAQVIDKNGAVLVEGSWDCEMHQATISGITPGEGIVVKVIAKDVDGVVLFEGQSDPLIVVAGQTTDAGLITLTSINRRLNGNFISTGFGFDDSGFFFWSIRSDANFDGTGGGSFQDVAFSDDSLESGTLTYNLSFDGSLSATLSNGTMFDGILNANDNILAVADTDLTDDSIEMDVVIKKSTGLSNAILNGEYIGVRVSSVPSTTLSTVTFHGDSTGEFKFLAASDDDLTSGGFAYSVGLDGDATIVGIGTGAVSSEGIVSGDGKLVSLVDTDFRGGSEDIDMTVLIKTGSGLSNAAINGDYTAVSFGFYLGEGFDEETSIMSISADGGGNMEIEVLSSSSGFSDAFEATYTVNSDGRIRIVTPDKEFLDGVVNADGDVFTFVDTGTSDDFIEIAVAIKKTP